MRILAGLSVVLFTACDEVDELSKRVSVVEGDVGTIEGGEDYVPDQDSLAQLRADIVALQKADEDLRDENAALSDENAALRDQIADLQESLDELKGEGFAEDDTIASLRLQVNDNSAKVFKLYPAVWWDQNGTPNLLDDDINLVQSNNEAIQENSDAILGNTTSITSQNNLLSADIALLNAEVFDVDGSSIIASNTSLINTNITNITTNAGDIVTNTMDIEDLIEALSNLDDRVVVAEDRVSSLPDAAPALLEEDTTYTIGSSGDYADLNEAFSDLQSVTIPSGVTVTLQVEEDQTYTEPILVNHRNGASIQIVGSPDATESIVLTFERSNGIVVERGFSLGLLKDLKLVGSGAYVGVLADIGSWVRLSGIDSENFTYGYHAIRGGYIQEFGSVGSSLTAASNTSSFYASYLGGIWLESQSVADMDNNYGFVSIANGTIRARQTKSSNALIGYYAVYDGFIDAVGAEAEANNVGFLALGNGTIYAQNSIATDGRIGFDVRDAGYIRSPGSQCSEMEDTCFRSRSNGTIEASHTTSSNALNYDYASYTEGVLISTSLDEGGDTLNQTLTESATESARIYSVE